MSRHSRKHHKHGRKYKSRSASSKETYFQQPSVMDAVAHFSQVPGANIERSRFDRSFGVKTTFDAGVLCPIFVDEVLPGDTFQVSATCFSRLSTPLKPVMDNIYQDIHFFFVPYRLVWEHWQEFMGERRNPDDDPTDLSIPTVTIDVKSNLIAGTNFDYVGLPQTPGDVNVTVSALPFRAINLIWNEWYRDENLQDRVPENFDDGPDDPGDYISLHPRGKRKDYFTSALPWPQKGDPVTVPLTGYAPIKINPESQWDLNQWYVEGGGHNQLVTEPKVPAGGPGTGLETPADYPSTGTSGYYPVINNVTGAYETTNLSADLSGTSSVSINDLRTAFQVQRLLERDARGGTRYIELLRSHFGVISDDARLQRPEYLGGGTTRIAVSPVAATVAVSGGAPQGNLAAVATSVLPGGFSKSFVEHGVVIGFVSARADLTYQQGVERS